MRRQQRLANLIPSLFIIASVLFAVQPVFAASGALAGAPAGLWVDAQNGNDANSGTSSASAFRTIQAAARVAGPGTTVHILPGIYREMVTPAQDGTAAAPIVYKAENGPGTAIVRGSEASSSLTWSRLASNSIGLPAGVNPTNIYYVDLSSWALSGTPRFVVQLDGNGVTRLPLAREPDWNVVTPWKYAEFWWTADGGSSVPTCDPVTNQNHDCDISSRSTTQLIDRTSDSQPAGIAPGNLTTLGSLIGATLVALDTDEGHYVYHRKIVAHDVAAGTVTVDQPSQFDSGSGQGGLGWGSKYYVENLPSLLDTPGEWWFDKTGGRLYLWPTQPGDPAAQNIEISRRSVGFNLTGRSYITLEGLAMEFLNGSAIRELNGDNNKSYGNTVRNVSLRYANMGVEIGQVSGATLTNITNGFTLEDSVIAHMDTFAVRWYQYWSGTTADTFTHVGIVNTVIRNNEMYDLAFRSDEDNTDGIWINFPNDLRFENNYVHDVAHNGIVLWRSVVQSTKDRGFTPDEIKIGHILIKDNIVERACMLGSDCGALKMGGGTPDYAVYRDVLITGNVFRNNIGWTSVAEKRGQWSGGTGSEVRGMGGFGLYLDNASGVNVYRNISYNNAFSDYHFYEYWGDGDLVLYNNIAANSLNGINLDGYTPNSFNTQIGNNILVNNAGYGIRIFQSSGTTGTFSIDHDLYYNNGWRTYENGGQYQPGDMTVRNPSAYYPALAAVQAGTPWEDHGVEGDPRFVNYNVADHNLFDGSWPDFHLTSASSNAIDRGTTGLPSSLSAVLTLFGIADGRVGPAFDIGRFEAGTTGPALMISGSAGVAGATITYTGGTTTTDTTGAYSFTVAYGWSGTVSASKAGYTFSAPHVYSNVTANQTGQDFTPDQNASAQVRIANTPKGTYDIPSGGSVTPQYPGVMDGPVEVSSDFNVFTSERALYGPYQTFNEVMGYPDNKLTTKYYFPWYDDASMQTWILVGNPDPNPLHTATVHITIGGHEVSGSPFTIAGGANVTPEFPGLMDGPVVVSSNVNVFASERALYGPASSFNEVMGYPDNQLTKKYYFSWYDDASMQTWILVGHPDPNPLHTATVHITIGGHEVTGSPFTIAGGANITAHFPGLMDGPVVVSSDANVFTSERALYGPYHTFNEVMGYPDNQLTTKYYFPWYDGISMTTWILVGNPDPNPLHVATVHIRIHGIEVQGSPFSIAGGANITPQFAGVMDGPVEVSSDINVFASERALYGAAQSFNEVMGYPGNQLTSHYWFPWYDDASMKTWALIGKP